jgi:hypothetical protein
MIKKLSEFLKDNQPASKSSGFRRRVKPGQNVDVFDFISLVEAWPQIVGEKIAEHTSPVKNQNKVLTILTSHSVFNDQLSFMHNELKQKIIKFFPALNGQIREIRFQCNPGHFVHKQEEQKVEQKKAPKKLHQFSPEYKRLKQEAIQSVGDLPDKDLQEQLVSIYIQSKLNQSS